MKVSEEEKYLMNNEIVPEPVEPYTPENLPTSVSSGWPPNAAMGVSLICNSYTALKKKKLRFETKFYANAEIPVLPLYHLHPQRSIILFTFSPNLGSA